MRPYYHHDERPRGGFGMSFGSRWTNTVKALVLANAAAFLLIMLLRRYFGVDQVGVSIADKWLGFYSPYFFRGAIWQPVTSMFVHGDFWHIVMNMLGLYFFGGDVERSMGRKHFLLMYFLCGSIGAVLCVFQPPIPGVGAVPAIGASGGTLGVLVAFAIFRPHARIFLFPIPIPIRARYLAMFYAFMTVVNVFRGPADGTAHWGHLGGIVVAFLYVKGRPAALKLLYKWGAAQQRSRTRRSAAEQAELDRVLEKVHRDGINSLSNHERDFLNMMSRKYQDSE